jgi:tryptophanyl-tRNA synthetase
MHKVFSSPDEISMVDLECRRAGIGCVECKQLYARNLNTHLAPFRHRRAELGKDTNLVWDVLRDGQQRAQAIARQTMVEVRQAIGLP